MIEIKFRPMHHAQLLHHTPRSLIRKRSNRDHFLEAELPEGILDDGGCTLRRKTLTLTRLSQTPANLNRRLRQIGHEVTHHLKSDDSSERIGLPQNRDKKTKSIPIESRVIPCNRLIALLRRHRSSEVVHHHRVSIHRGKRRTVFLLPAAKDQARCFELEQLVQFFFLTLRSVQLLCGGGGSGGAG